MQGDARKLSGADVLAAFMELFACLRDRGKLAASDQRWMATAGIRNTQCIVASRFAL